MMIIYWQVYSRRDSIYTQYDTGKENKQTRTCSALVVGGCCCCCSLMLLYIVPERWLLTLLINRLWKCFVSITFLKFIFKQLREKQKRKKKKRNWLEKENKTKKKIEAVGGIIIMDIFLVFVGDFDFFFPFFNFSQFMQRWTHFRFIEPWLDEATTGSYQSH